MLHPLANFSSCGIFPAHYSFPSPSLAPFSKLLGERGSYFPFLFPLSWRTPGFVISLFWLTSGFRFFPSLPSVTPSPGPPVLFRFGFSQHSEVRTATDANTLLVFFFFPPMPSFIPLSYHSIFPFFPPCLPLCDPVFLCDLSPLGLPIFFSSEPFFPFPFQLSSEATFFHTIPLSPSSASPVLFGRVTSALWSSSLFHNGPKSC